MATYPDVIETIASEINDDGSETVGTIIDATDQNHVYALLVALQTTVGPNTDPAAGMSHEARLKAIEAVAVLSNPMTAAGDTLYALDNSGTPGRLAIGTPGDVLTVAAGLPVWAPPSGGGGFADPMTAAGDLIRRDASNLTARLAAGSAGQLLGISSGLPTWITPPFIPAPGSPTQGDTLFYNGSTWTRLGPGTAGQFLQTFGASSNPAWANLPSSPPGSAIEAPVGAAQGNLLYFDGVDWLPLPVGTSGQFLKTNGIAAAPTWATPAGGMTNPLTQLSDLMIGLTGGAPGRLGIGTNGYVLSVVAGAPAWAANPAGFADPLTTRGDLIVRGGSGTTRLGLGATGTVLTSNGTDATWAAAGAAASDYLTPIWWGGD